MSLKLYKFFWCTYDSLDKEGRYDVVSDKYIRKGGQPGQIHFSVNLSKTLS